MDIISHKIKNPLNTEISYSHQFERDLINSDFVALQAKI